MVVCVALSKLGVVPSLLSVLLYLVALGFGVAVHYSIMLGLAAVSFWIVRAQGLVYGYFNFLNIARYPDVDFPAAFPIHFRLDHSGRDRGKHSGAAAHQIAWATRLAHVSSHRRLDDRLLAVARFLALCPATLLERQLVSYNWVAVSRR